MMIKNKDAQLSKVRLVCYSLCKMHIYELHKQLPTHKQHKHKYKHKHKQLPTQPSRHDPAFPAIPILTQEQQSGELLATNCGNCTPRLKPAPFFRNTNLYNFRCNGSYQCNVYTSPHSLSHPIPYNNGQFLSNHSHGRTM